MERTRGEANASILKGKKFGSFFSLFCTEGEEKAKLFSEVKRPPSPCRRSTALFLARDEGTVIPATRGDEERRR